MFVQIFLKINCRKGEQNKLEIKLSAISVRRWPLGKKNLRPNLQPGACPASERRFKGSGTHVGQELWTRRNGEALLPSHLCAGGAAFSLSGW